MKTYAQVLRSLEDQLEAVGEEAAALSYVFKELKGWTTTDLVLHLAKPIAEEDHTLLKEIYAKLSQHIPAQHITGQAYFKDLVLTVNPDVLIPRPETEELVDLILLENSRADFRVLDIGTGSGAIALSLKQARPDWRLVASDISPNALKIAQENANRYQLDVTFVQSNVYERIEGNFDIIVSNPPYIAHEDKEEVGQNVLLFEPHTALFADQDGYAIYQEILAGAVERLNAGGKLYFEIGYKQGQGLQQLAQEFLPQKRVRILQDFYGKDRMVVIDDYE